MGNLTIQLGEYTLKPLDDESYWLEARNGEGTGIAKKFVSHVIEAYFTGCIDDYFKIVM